MKTLTDKLRVVYPKSTLIVIGWSLHSYRGAFSNRDAVEWNLYIEGVGNRDFVTFEALLQHVDELTAPKIAADTLLMCDDVLKKGGI
jgi:hypothetical protein